MDELAVSARVRELVEPVLTERGFELFDVEHTGNLVRVTVDRQGGIDLDGLSEATRCVSDEVDRSDILPERCVLEVSSPGLERRLRTPEHFRRAIGSTVAVKTRPGTEGDRRLEGTLESADDEGIVVGGRRLAYADIDRARTVVDWAKELARTSKGEPPRAAREAAPSATASRSAGPSPKGEPPRAAREAAPSATASRSAGPSPKGEPR